MVLKSIFTFNCFTKKTNRMSKKNLLFVLLSFILFSSCNESDEMGEHNLAKISTIREKIVSAANDYGLSENFLVNDAKLYRIMDISDKEIEREMKLFSMLKGSYELLTDVKNRFYLGTKLARQKSRKKSIQSFPDDPEYFAEVREPFNSGDTVMVMISFDVCLRQSQGKPVTSNERFEITVRLVDQNNEYYYDKDEGKPSLRVTSVIGALPNLSMMFEATINTKFGTYVYPCVASFHVEPSGRLIPLYFMIK